MERERNPGKTKEGAETRPSASEALPDDIDLLLMEIEKEPVPERLLELAEKLQTALVRRRRARQQ